MMQLRNLAILALNILVLSGLCAGHALAEEGIKVERIFGSEAPGPYKHPATITQLANGDLYLAYYGGEGEYATDTKDYGSRLVKGTTQWTPPEVIADTPFRSEGNAVVWQSPNELVWLFYVDRPGDTWSSSRIRAKISRDGAHTWSDPMMLAYDAGMMVQGAPIVLHDGDYLLPTYHETGADREKTGPDCTSRFMRFHDADKSWIEQGKIVHPNGSIQPGVVELEPNHLIAYCRRGGDYEPTTKGYIVRSESTDGGKTWSPGKDSQFPNPNAAIAFLKLKSGHLLLVYNDSMVDRDPLTAAISTDNDKTWPHKRNIARTDDGQGDFAYPYAIQLSDGTIKVIFTSNKRSVINIATFKEEAILGNKK